MDLSGLYYANRFARALLIAMREGIGEYGTAEVLNLAGIAEAELPPDTLERGYDFAYIAAISQALEGMYGKKGGRGFAMRVGQQAYAAGFSNTGAMRGLTDPAFSLLPRQKRVHLGLWALTGVLNGFTDQRFTLVEADDAFHLKASVTPMAWGRTAEKPVCHAHVGLMQACLRSIGGGYEYVVQEIACHAAGAEACVFSVNKQPIGQI